MEKNENKDVNIVRIPNDWSYTYIESLIDLLTGFPFPSNQYANDGIKLLRCSNVKRGVTDWTDEITKYWKEITPNLKEYILNEGDIVIAMDGSLVGKSFARLSKSDLPALLLQRVARVRSHKVDMGFLKEFICSDYFIKHCENVKTASAIPHISPKDIKDFRIPVPPTREEQKAIATALNDTDELISKLEKLITKKRAIKQGAMQELLKPKEGWSAKTLIEIADFKKELFDDGDWIESEHITNDGVRLIQTGNISVGKFFDKESKKYIYEDSFIKLNCKPLIVGDLLICRLAEPAGRACIFPEIGEIKVVTSVDVTIFRPRKEVANRVFLSNLFSTSGWFKAVTEKVGGTTHKRISRGALGKILISLPDIEEQSRIAIILSDMDLEIESLEMKLEKYKLLKQGMMQNLLTGKIRLV